MIDLYRKYLEEVPRYASYPTVRGWSNQFKSDEWLKLLEDRLPSAAQLGVYVHVPFCESLCGFCGCNTSITQDHSIESAYVDQVLKEWQVYQARVQPVSSAKLKKLYLGGGTPNFLSAEQLSRLLDGLALERDEGFVGYAELDPRQLSEDQVQVLVDHGFGYASLGIQDLDDEIMRPLREGQTEELIREKVAMLRKQGIGEISFDLMYGLPGQTVSSWRETLLKFEDLKPERVALYRWVVSPWMKVERDSDDPYNWEIYDMIRNTLIELGYRDLGMDHFVRPSSRAQKASERGDLDRSFSGYQCVSTDATIGLGVSAISEFQGNYHQNEKALPVYQREVGRGNLPSFRGVMADSTQMRTYEQISRLSLDHEVSVDEGELNSLKSDLPDLFERNLAIVENSKVKLTRDGVPFLRAVAYSLERHIEMIRGGE